VCEDLILSGAGSLLSQSFSLKRSSPLGDSDDLFANTYLNDNLERQAAKESNYLSFNTASVKPVVPTSYLHHQYTCPVSQPEQYQSLLSETSYSLTSQRLEATSGLSPLEAGQFLSSSYADDIANPLGDASIPANLDSLALDLFNNSGAIDDSVFSGTKDDIGFGTIGPSPPVAPHSLGSPHQPVLGLRLSRSILPGYESHLYGARHFSEDNETAPQVVSRRTVQTPISPQPPASSSSPRSDHILCTWPSCGKSFESTSDYK